MTVRETEKENTLTEYRKKLALYLLAKQTQVVTERSEKTNNSTWMNVHETGL
jgi:hypothetical protein